MNAIAGIIIGWFAETWGVRLAAPLAWGAIWCVRCWLTSSSATFRLNEASAGRRWGLSDAGAFYFIEYGTAVMTTMFMAAVVVGIKMLLE